VIDIAKIVLSIINFILGFLSRPGATDEDKEIQILQSQRDNTIRSVDDADKLFNSIRDSHGK
jgi:hypothetical protein